MSDLDLTSIWDTAYPPGARSRYLGSARRPALGTITAVEGDLLNDFSHAEDRLNNAAMMQPRREESRGG